MVSDIDLFREIYIDIRHSELHERKGMLSLLEAYMDGSVIVSRFGEKFNLIPNLKYLTDVFCYVYAYCEESEEFNLTRFAESRVIELDLRECLHLCNIMSLSSRESRKFPPLIHLIKLLNEDVKRDLPKFREFIDSMQTD